jgi:hypothetical protein
MQDDTSRQDDATSQDRAPSDQGSGAGYGDQGPMGQGSDRGPDPATDLAPDPGRSQPAAAEGGDESSFDSNDGDE